MLRGMRCLSNGPIVRFRYCGISVDARRQLHGLRDAPRRGLHQLRREDRGADPREGRTTPVRAWGDENRPQLSVALTVPRLQILHHGSRYVLDRLSALSEDIGSALKGGVKICQR